MDSTTQASISDDEDDLEALRLAALQTLKKNVPSQSASSIPNGVISGNRNDHRHNRRAGQRHQGNYPNKRGTFYGGRGTKNGQYSSNVGRHVSSNLISLTPDIRTEKKPSQKLESSSNEFTLPQDKWAEKKTLQETKPEGAASKFDRYKDSDKSEEEDSEDEILKTDSEDDDSPSKLERSDSLEALMQELDDEIQGKNTVKQSDIKVKIKKRKKEASKTEPEESPSAEPVPKPVDPPIVEDKLAIVDEKNQDEPDEDTNIKKNDDKVNPENLEKVIPKQDRSPGREPQLKKRRHAAPLPKRGFRGGFRGQQHNFQRPPFIPGTEPLPFVPNQPPLIFNNPPPFAPPNFIINPSLVPRPLSPLLINAETLQTQTMAPLSPRSAAFVLQNRAIIEKRKRSPRRSYSRSPSPRRRSVSPRRSPTPPCRRSMSPRKRSLSPKQRLSSLSPPRKRSLSPLRKRSRSPKRVPFSPRRRSPSPKRRNFSPKQRPLSPKLKPFSPKRRSQSPKRRSLSPRKHDKKDVCDNAPKAKPSIRERLGYKAAPSKPEEKEVKEKTQADQSPTKDEKPLDPVLEARKRKFESKEIKVREGVIRLKPKDEDKPPEALKPEKIADEASATKTEPFKEPVKEPVAEVAEKAQKEAADELLNEDALLEYDELDLESHLHLFSDEESGSDNEGRFKVKEQSGEKPLVSTLVNGVTKELQVKRRHESRSKKARARSRSPREKPKRSPQEKTEAPQTEKSAEESTSKRSKYRLPKIEKLTARKKLGVKSERHPKKFERKIEIKIKNPSKYQRTDKSLEDEKGSKPEKEGVIRKVELGSVGPVASDEDDDETEIVVEHDDDDEVENTANKEGDLRAQLSKKRAEKMQHKHVKSRQEGVTSRLLQNALENALPIKRSKSKKSKELSSSDGKVPIHLRLGLAYGPEAFPKTKRKSKKRKSANKEDQV